MRLVTRADFDGLICSVLLSQVENIDDIELVHPKDIHDKIVPINSNDIIANLPYHPDTGMWFDHHSSEAIVAENNQFRGKFEIAPSCASVIYEHYSQFDELKRFLPIVIEADKIDSARFNKHDISNPKGWILVSKTMHVYSNEKGFEEKYSYFNRLMNQVGSRSPEEILQDPEVLGRIAFLQEEQSEYIGTISRYTRVDENIIITDIRSVDYLPNGDKFLVYTLYPDQNVSLKVFNKRHTEDTVISGGYNIFNRTCKTHIGDLMHCFGGGGHKAAGSCRIKRDDADDVLNNIIAKLREFKHLVN